MNNTVNRASLGAKKNNLIKWLLSYSHEKQSPQRFARYAAMLIMLLTLGVGQMWAYYGIELRSDYYTGGWSYTSETFTYGGDGQKYWDVYHTGSDSYWRIKIGGDDYGPVVNNQAQNVGYAGYKVSKQASNSFKTSDNAGILRICTNQVSGGEYSPYVWVERPGVVFKHNWNGGGDADWTEANADDNRDGTYTYRGTYGGTNYFNAKSVNGAWKVAKTNTNVIGSPSTGNRCEFKWEPTGYKFSGGEEDNRGVFTITKLVTITFDGNGKTKGDLPSAQEVLYNTTSTLAGSCSIEKVGAKFVGWNTRADGNGTDYTVNGSIKITSNITLYAKWADADVWRIKGAKTSVGGTDYLGNWGRQNFFTYSSEHALAWSVYLDASQTYEFGIVKESGGSETWYGNGGSISGTTSAEWQPDGNWTFETGKGNSTLTTSTAGTYVFTIDATAGNPRLRVYFPGDAPKVFLKGNQYIYLDGATNSVWKEGSYNSDFWFKATTEDVHASAIECLYSNAIGVNYMYYVQVPDNDYVDRVQINRMNPSGGAWNYSQVKHGYTRTNAKQNCLVLPNSGEWGNGTSNWASLSWSTYCPPMQSATLTHDATNTKTYGGNGETSTPYIVATSSSICVSATSVSKVDDGDMTAYYQFKKAGSNDGVENSTNTHTYTASSTSGTKQAMTVVARNYLYSTAAFYGTASPVSNSIYYEARTPYSVDHDLSHVTSSFGETGAAAIVENIEYTASFEAAEGYELPDDIEVLCGEDDITADCSWSQELGRLSIPAAQVTGNITITITGVAKTYTASDNLDKTTGDSHGQYTATFDATTIAIGTTPVKANYHVEGYYLESDFTTKIADAAGTLVKDVEKSSVTYTDGGGKWKKDGNVTLYTKWEENSFTVTINAGSHGTVSTTSVTGHPITASSNFTVTANAGYSFSHWTLSAAVADTNFVSRGGTNYATQTFNITTTAAVTITANYVPRYGLYGSLDNVEGGNEYGMPGWGVSADFEYSAGSYTITRDLTKPNANYKFRVLDRRNNFSYGCSENYTYAKNDETLTLNSGNYNAYIGTAGRGSYTFTITEVSSGAYPAIQITSHPESKVVKFGVKSFTAEGADAGDLGGTITVSDAATDGNTYDYEKYIATDEEVYVKATDIPTGYHFEGWYSSSDYSSRFATENPTHWTVSANVNAYAKFVEDVITPTGSGGWSTKVPASTLTDVVIISSTITVDVDHALAKRVILDQSGDGKAGKLVITANKGLEVAEGIWIKKSTGLVAPTAEDLVLESSASGNATLIFDNDNSAAATIGMYSKASVVGETWKWQYMASPYVTASALHNYYGSYLYRWGNGDKSTTGWFAVPNGGSVVPFVAYCITNKTAGTYYQMDGTMVATDGNDQTISVPAGESWVVGNSWTAPIQIGQLQDADFVGLLKNVYLYNTGMDEKGAALEVANPEGEARYAANTYVSIPIHSALYTDISVVSSLQGFYVKDDPLVAGGGTLKLNYTNHVRPSDGNSIQNGAMHAPKRIVADENEPNVLKIKVCGSKYDDRLVLLERADFSMGYDAGWDGDKMGNVAASPRITVEREDGTSDAVSAVPDLEGLAINFRAANTDNQQTLYFEYSDDIDPLYIVDVTNNEYTRVLTGNSYTFSTSDNEEHPRFILTRYGAPQITTGVDEVYNANSARKQMINGTLYIIRDGRIYNAEGALVK